MLISLKKRGRDRKVRSGLQLSRSRQGEAKFFTQCSNAKIHQYGESGPGMQSLALQGPIGAMPWTQATHWQHAWDSTTAEALLTSALADETYKARRRARERNATRMISDAAEGVEQQNNVSVSRLAELLRSFSEMCWKFLPMFPRCRSWPSH